VDYVGLGFKGDKDPRQENISKTKRNAILDEMMAACRGYIAGEFLETLKKTVQRGSGHNRRVES
jgi:hypothetical protein